MLLHVICYTFSVCHQSVAVVGSFGGSGAGIGVRRVDRDWCRRARLPQVVVVIWTPVSCSVVVSVFAAGRCQLSATHETLITQTHRIALIVAHRYSLSAPTAPSARLVLVVRGNGLGGRPCGAEGGDEGWVVEVPFRLPCILLGRVSLPSDAELLDATVPNLRGDDEVDFEGLLLALVGARSRSRRGVG